MVDSFNSKINQVKLESQGLIKSFDFFVDLLIAYNKEGNQLDIESLIDKKVFALFKQAFKQENPDLVSPQPDIKLDIAIIIKHIKSQEQI